MLDNIKDTISFYVPEQTILMSYKISKVVVGLSILTSPIVVVPLFRYFVKKNVLEATSEFESFYNDFCYKDSPSTCEFANKDGICDAVGAMLYVNEKIEAVYNFTNFFDYSEGWMGLEL